MRCLILLLFLAGCSTYKGGGQSRISIGKDTASELIYEDRDKSLYYSTASNESQSFTGLLKTATAAIATLGASSAWKNGVKRLKK